jgi:hypothetical protein
VFGAMQEVELKPGGAAIPVTEKNKVGTTIPLQSKNKSQSGMKGHRSEVCDHTSTYHLTQVDLCVRPSLQVS